MEFFPGKNKKLFAAKSRHWQRTSVKFSGAFCGGAKKVVSCRCGCVGSLVLLVMMRIRCRVWCRVAVSKIGWWRGRVIAGVKVLVSVGGASVGPTPARRRRRNCRRQLGRFGKAAVSQRRWLGHRNGQFAAFNKTRNGRGLLWLVSRCDDRLWFVGVDKFGRVDNVRLLVARIGWTFFRWSHVGTNVGRSNCFLLPLFSATVFEPNLNSWKIT